MNKSLPGQEDQGFDEQFFLQAAQDGDVEAFNRLVTTHQQRIYNLAYRLLGDGDEAADVTQDVFIAAFRYLPHFIPSNNNSLRAWLCRVATNACYDRLRVRKRRPSTSLDAIVDNEDSAVDGFPDPRESPEDFLVRQELSGDLQNALAMLPPEQRAAIILFDVQGYSLDETSVALNVPVGTVKSRLSRARERLRLYLLNSTSELFKGDKRLDTRGKT